MVLPCSRGFSTALRITVVDDERMVLNVVVRMLERAGFEVQSFSDPRDALAALEQAVPDLLVTDFTMPRMNGGVLAERVRALHPGLPIVLMTGFRGAVGEDQLGYFDRIVDKPFVDEDLCQVIDALVGPDAGPREGSAAQASGKQTLRLL